MAKPRNIATRSATDCPALGQPAMFPPAQYAAFIGTAAPMRPLGELRLSGAFCRLRLLKSMLYMRFALSFSTFSLVFQNGPHFCVVNCFNTSINTKGPEPRVNFYYFPAKDAKHRAAWINFVYSNDYLHPVIV